MSLLQSNYVWNLEKRSWWWESIRIVRSAYLRVLLLKGESRFAVLLEREYFSSFPEYFLAAGEGISMPKMRLHLRLFFLKIVKFLFIATHTYIPGEFLKDQPNGIEGFGFAN